MSIRCRWWRAVACAAVALSASAVSSFAQSVSRPAGVRVTQKDWVFVPVVVQGSGSLEIPGVLALRDESLIVGQNIVSVWYSNPGVPGAEWPAVAWESQDQWEAIKWTKEAFGISDAYDFLWPTTDAPFVGGSTEVPQNYFKGLLTSDPFAALVAQPDGDQIVELLASMGYKAASIAIDQNGQCSTKVILAALADTTAFAVLAQPPVQQVRARYSSLVPASCAQVVPPPAVGFVPGTTIPLPGTPLTPAAPWQRDSRPGFFDPTCTTATTCCYQAPIIWLYTTTNWLGMTVIHYCEGEISWTCPVPPGVPTPPCPATPNCAEPLGPHLPSPPGPGVPPVGCGNSYY